ncbi:MAG: hypothetical protein ORN29_01665 [Rhodoferax sp.]|nr:hypothetical protein [Rhodoferax sp.]
MLNTSITMDDSQVKAKFRQLANLGKTIDREGGTSNPLYAPDSGGTRPQQ